jgi:hypothetical protein
MPDDLGTVIRRAVTPVLLVASMLGCTAVAAAPTRSVSPSQSEVVTSSALPTYEPAPGFATGTVIRLAARGVVLQVADGGELEVDLTGVRSVWKETEVAPSELEVGDQLDVGGARAGATFHATFVSANIGRFDGVVRAIVGGRLELVALPPSTRTFQVELSPYLVAVRVRGADILPATVADLRPGMTVGGVTYRPRNATPRATKIWF